jgi:tRNA (cytidine/uridine-2'-O-)-methyltransferase
MLNIALHTPQIPPNTGNIIRLMANTGFKLHLIEPLGFDFEEKQLRRAGLDYHDLSSVVRHVNFAAFIQTLQPKRLFAITTKGTTKYTDINYQEGDTLLFGSETSGLPTDVMEKISLANRIRIPMQPNNRSLNLSNSVSILAYEAWRQMDFIGGE